MASRRYRVECTFKCALLGESDDFHEAKMIANIHKLCRTFEHKCRISWTAEDGMSGMMWDDANTIDFGAADADNV